MAGPLLSIGIEAKIDSLRRSLNEAGNLTENAAVSIGKSSDKISRNLQKINKLDLTSFKSSLKSGQISLSGFVTKSQTASNEIISAQKKIRLGFLGLNDINLSGLNKSIANAKITDIFGKSASKSPAIDAAVEEVGKIEDAAEGASDAAGGLADDLTEKLAGAFSIAAIGTFVTQVINATVEFQKFQAVLSNTLGSSALADLKLSELQEFAAKTPFAINELTGAFVKLANSGFQPTGEQLTKLGDVASSTGKSFDQLAEAIIDAQTGEFERLKEFGIRAKDAGDSVVFTYKGVQTQVEKTSGSIREYIVSLGAAEGTSGAMAKISETLGGKISNLGDAWDQMLISVGKNTTGVFGIAISTISSAIEAITDYNKELELNGKYNLNQGISDTILKAIRSSVNLGAGNMTELEVMSTVFQSVNGEIADFVQKTNNGAKSAADFGKALADLKKKGDIQLKGISDTNFRVAIKDVYQVGIKALQDARNNFEKPKSDANFGTSKTGKDQGKIDESALKNQEALLVKIEELNEKYRLRGLTADESARESLINDFKRLGVEINQQARNFDAYAKKYGQIKALSLLGPKIDPSSINKSRDNALDSLDYQQNTELLKNQLDKEKELYKSYEDFKTSLGKSAADKRFQDDLRTEVTYLESLEAERKRILNGRQADDLSGDEKNRLKVVTNILNAVKQAERQQFDELLKANATYEQTRTAQVELYETQRAKLVADGALVEAAQLDRNHTLRLQSLDDQNAEQLSSFKALFQGIDRLGDTAAKNVLDSAKSTLDGLVKRGKISAELAKQITDRLTDTSRELSSRLPQNLLNIGSELQSLSGQVGDVDEGFGMWLSTLGGVVSGIGNIKSGIEGIKALKPGDVLGGISGGLGLFGAFMGIGETLAKVFDSIGRRQREQSEYSAQIQVKQNEAVSKSLDRQLSLIDKVYGITKIEAYKDAILGINGAIDDVSKQLSGKFRLTGNKVLDELLTDINNGKIKLDNALTKESVKNIQVYKLPLDDLNALRMLLDNGGLDEGTSRLVSQFIDLKERAIEAGNAIKEVATGTSFSALADSIVNLFEDGKASAEEFGKNFQDIVRDAVLQGFKTKVLSQQLQKFYDQLADLSESGGSLDTSEITTLRNAYDEIIKGGNSYFENLKKLGIDLGAQAGGANGSSSIKQIGSQITEETGSELSGRLLGVQLGVLDTNRILRVNSVYAEDTVNLLQDMQVVNIDIRDTNLRIANNTEWLAGIARSLINIENGGTASIVAAGGKVGP